MEIITNFEALEIYLKKPSTTSTGVPETSAIQPTVREDMLGVQKIKKIYIYVKQAQPSQNHIN